MIYINVHILFNAKMYVNQENLIKKDMFKYGYVLSEMFLFN